MSILKQLQRIGTRLHRLPEVLPDIEGEIHRPESRRAVQNSEQRHNIIVRLFSNVQAVGYPRGASNSFGLGAWIGLEDFVYRLESVVSGGGRVSDFEHEYLSSAWGATCLIPISGGGVTPVCRREFSAETKYRGPPRNPAVSRKKTIVTCESLNHI